MIDVSDFFHSPPPATQSNAVLEHGGFLMTEQDRQLEKCDVICKHQVTYTLRFGTWNRWKNALPSPTTRKN